VLFVCFVLDIVLYILACRLQTSLNQLINTRNMRGEITVEATNETKLSLLTDSIYWDSNSSQLTAAAIFHRIKLSQVNNISPDRNRYRDWFTQHLS
jgi:hypothetical protein